jgi:Zn-dependent membrane protease YugP
LFQSILISLVLFEAVVIFRLVALVRFWKARSAAEAEIKARKIETKAYLDKLENDIEYRI